MSRTTHWLSYFHFIRGLIEFNLVAYTVGRCCIITEHEFAVYRAIINREKCPDHCRFMSSVHLCDKIFQACVNEPAFGQITVPVLVVIHLYLDYYNMLMFNEYSMRCFGLKRNDVNTEWCVYLSSVDIYSMRVNACVYI